MNMRPAELDFDFDHPDSSMIHHQQIQRWQ
jgi:hypothetical protein